MTTTTEHQAGGASGAGEEHTSDQAKGRGEELVERLFAGLLGGIELLTVELGRQLGLYAAVREIGAATAGELAGRAGIAERYAREWLEQQAAAGILDVAAETGVAATRRFAVPDAHVPVLLDEEDSLFMMGAAPMLVGVGLPFQALPDAYRNGTGVAYADYGAEARHGIGAFNRPMFTGELAAWLTTMPDVTERLRSGGTVLDAGCGLGWSSIVIARAFPRARVHGVDLDEASITDARRNAEEAGVADRVTFAVANAKDPQAGPGGAGSYDLACVFEALHDMGEPIQALRSLRTALAPGGVVLVADELVADEFTAPAGEVERLQFACSVLHCLPATMAESTAVANGTILRTPTVRAWAAEAGFGTTTVLPIEHEFWRFYRLDR